ncbi:MAG: hypothetical protein IMF09_06565 [Proteobacteria bacterium]|nr:hypothetical protein [Pseudomonadota bacterium]
MIKLKYVLSQLTIGLLNRFHGVAAEILSLHYRSDRDGNETAIARVAASGNEA